MARYKYIDSQPKLIPVDLAAQLLPGSFEHALNHLVDHAVDLSHFDARFRNDETGAPAYPQALLLKVVLFAYSQGIVSRRQIARACQEHITFIALCGDQAPHFTTIAKFVSTLADDCPAGKTLYRKGASNITNGFIGEHFRGAKRDCVSCALRTQCLRTPNTTHVRNVAFFAGRAEPVARNYTAEIKVQLDTPDGRRQYGERFAAVEPVFGNLRANKLGSLHTPRPREGRRAVEAVLSCAQHRKARQSGLRSVTARMKRAHRCEQDGSSR